VATEKKDFSGDLFAQEALDFIDRSKDKPFFLYFASTIPHANCEGRVIEVPDLGVYKDKDWPEPRKRHAAVISRMDEHIGRIMQRLKDLGLDGDTIVLFTSDNGPHKEGANDPKVSNSSGPLRGIKRDLYEGGIRVPMIVRWPGAVKAGSTSEQTWAFWDFLPTAAEIGGAPAPAATDGISMLPAILGQKQEKQHEYLYWEFHEGGFKQAVRLGDWKAVRQGTKKPIELYDLKTDIGETKDVAAEHPDVVKHVEAILAAGRTDSKEFPIREPVPRKPATRPAGQ